IRGDARHLIDDVVLNERQPVDVGHVGERGASCMPSRNAGAFDATRATDGSLRHGDAVTLRPSSRRSAGRDARPVVGGASGQALRFDRPLRGLASAGRCIGRVRRREGKGMRHRGRTATVVGIVVGLGVLLGSPRPGRAGGSNYGVEAPSMRAEPLPPTGVFEAARESLFGNVYAEPTRWRPLSLSTFFTAGW